MQDLHSLQDKVLPLTPRLRSTLATVTLLKKYNETLRKSACCKEALYVEIADELESYDVQLNGNLASVTLLEKRVQEILNLVSSRCLKFGPRIQTDLCCFKARRCPQPQKPSHGCQDKSQHLELDQRQC